MKTIRKIGSILLIASVLVTASAFVKAKNGVGLTPAPEPWQPKSYYWLKRQEAERRQKALKTLRVKATNIKNILKNLETVVPEKEKSNLKIVAKFIDEAINFSEIWGPWEPIEYQPLYRPGYRSSPKVK